MRVSFPGEEGSGSDGDGSGAAAAVGMGARGGAAQMHAPPARQGGWLGSEFLTALETVRLDSGWIREQTKPTTNAVLFRVRAAAAGGDGRLTAGPAVRAGQNDRFILAGFAGVVLYRSTN